MSEAVPRLVVEAADGWQVVHPFTGRVQFATTDRQLAEAVRGVFDLHDPVDVTWLVKELYRLPPPARAESEWVMSSATHNRLRATANAAGAYIWMPPVIPSDPDVLVGRPVRLDDDAVGVTLRSQA